MPLDPEPDAPYWPDIVGDRWPTLGPDYWYRLGHAATTGADALDIGSVDTAMAGFDASVRVSAALDPVKAALLTHRNRLQDFSDVLRITGEVFDRFGSLVHDTQNDLMDLYETTIGQVNAVPVADPEDAAARQQAADRIHGIVEQAAHRADGILTRARARLGSSEFRGLQAIADLLGTDDPLNHRASGPGNSGGHPGHPSGRWPGGSPQLPPYPQDLVLPLMIQAGFRGLVTDPTVPIPLPGLAALADALGLGHLPGLPTLDDLPAGPGGPGGAVLPLGPPSHAAPAGPVGGSPSTGGTFDGAYPGAFGAGPPPAGNPGPGWHGSGPPAHDDGPPSDTAPDNGSRPDLGGDPTDGFGGPVGVHRSGDDVDQPASGSPLGGTSGVPQFDSDASGVALGHVAGAIPGPDPVAAAAAALAVPMVTAPQAGPAPAISSEGVAAQASSPAPGGAAGHAGSPAPGPSTAVPRVSVGTPGHPGPPVAGKPPATNTQPEHHSESSADLVRDAVGAAMAAATPAFVLGERVDGDLVLARTLLRSMLAVVDTSPVAPGWAVAALRHSQGVSAFLTSTEGRGWLPTGLYLPREASIPWVWEVALESGWEGVADPARILVEFGLAWRAQSGARLSAVVSSRPLQAGLADLLPGVALEGDVTAAPELDLSAPRPGLVDRLGVVAAPQLLEQVEAFPAEQISARCLELALTAHGWLSALPDALGVVPLRARILAALRQRRPIPDGWWAELRDADDLLAATAFPLLTDASRIPLRELRSAGRENAALRTLLFQRRGNELVLLLAAEPTRQVLRDVTYTHAHLTSHPAFERAPVPPERGRPGPGPGGRPTITAGPDRR
ncbi:hypothetical protein [Nocardia stercoris]|uniref:Uncharacterized protein n=1 Tax=Nocardia stercoris TaxID=2483361 RepID=A0A3M2KVN0_9NOCA|nr:hypothetical protein [Nocardia stercoris]RMI29529.1 hypothetical protein EBN03_26020 [Nocardia stercoris]